MELFAHRTGDGAARGVGAVIGGNALNQSEFVVREDAAGITDGGYDVSTSSTAWDRGRRRGLLGRGGGVPCRK